MSLITLFVAILPGVLICYYINHLDKYEKEPKGLLVKSFIWGMMSAFPALVGQLFFKALHLEGGLGYELLFAFAIVGVTEECCKFFFLRYLAYPKEDFNEPTDGIVYAVMIGMGFATLENVLYSLSDGFGTAIARGLTAVPAHGAFAVLMGAYVGLSKFNPDKRVQFQLTGLILAILFHGAYDFFLLEKDYGNFTVLSIFILFTAVLIARQLIRRNDDLSPFKPKDNHV